MSLHMLGMLLLAPAPSFAQQGYNAAAAASPCPGDNGGVTLPPGFYATLFADHIGHARQMAFGPNAVLYVNTWSGTFFRNDTPPRGRFLLALQDTARGALCDRDAAVRALKSGKLAGYAGDLWYPQPAPADHPWRTMP